MSRDHRKLRVFRDAHALAILIYKTTKGFPVEERFGLQAQIRKAAVSGPNNIVEGCARRSAGDLCRFVDIAAGSVAEVRYLAELCAELGFLSVEDQKLIEERARPIAAGLQHLMRALTPPESWRSRQP